MYLQPESNGQYRFDPASINATYKWLRIVLLYLVPIASPLGIIFVVQRISLDAQINIIKILPYLGAIVLASIAMVPVMALTMKPIFPKVIIPYEQMIITTAGPLKFRQSVIDAVSISLKKEIQKTKNGTTVYAVIYIMRNNGKKTVFTRMPIAKAEETRVAAKELANILNLTIKDEIPEGPSPSQNQPKTFMEILTQRKDKSQ